MILAKVLPMYVTCRALAEVRRLIPGKDLISKALLLHFIQRVCFGVELPHVEMLSCTVRCVPRRGRFVWDCEPSCVTKDNSRPKHGTNPASTSTDTQGSGNPCEPSCVEFEG
jgi:hypothetical protein